MPADAKNSHGSLLLSPLSRVLFAIDMNPVTLEVRAIQSEVFTCCSKDAISGIQVFL
jgi:hypothetical protein